MRELSDAPSTSPIVSELCNTLPPLPGFAALQRGEHFVRYLSGSRCRLGHCRALCALRVSDGKLTQTVLRDGAEKPGVGGETKTDR